MKPASTAAYERLLVLRCQNGDRAALEELVKTWEERLFFYVRKLAADDHEAWRILQDVWVAVLSNIRGLRDPGRLRPWLYSIARKTAMSGLRDRYARRQLLDAARHEPPAPAGDDPGLRQIDDADALNHGLARIELIHREVLSLHFLQDLSTREIAEVLGIPPGTVKSRLYHARQALRAVLQEGDRP